jgi:hypothetical protein
MGLAHAKWGALSGAARAVTIAANRLNRDRLVNFEGGDQAGAGSGGRTLRNRERQTQLERVTLPRTSCVTGQAGLGSRSTFHKTIPTTAPKK